MKLLIVGDEPQNRRLVSRGFAAGPYKVQSANCRAAVESLLASHRFRAACVDIAMKSENSLAIIEAVRGRVPQLPIVALMDSNERKLSVTLRALGVCAQIRAPFSIEGLRAAIATHALKEPVGAAPNPTSVPIPVAETSVGSGERVGRVYRDEIGKSAFEMATRAAPSNAAILVLGETGTGKSALAQTIHEHSTLRQRPFVTVSCPSLSGELLESDLFGHVRGAFTGAVQDTWGKVAAAEGGTLFLDEIGDLPAALQPKLLRLLQEKKYERVGETTSRSANVRIVAATNRDLKTEVAAGRFREDLYYRINVISIEVPPLRTRVGDIMVAARIFLDEISRELGRSASGFTRAARLVLESYPWPGNLRELRNAIERAVILSAGGVLDASDFPSLEKGPNISGCQIGSAVSLQCVEEAHIRTVIANSASLEEASRILQIDKSTLYRRRKAMGEPVAKFAPAMQEMVGAAG